MRFVGFALLMGISSFIAIGFELSRLKFEVGRGCFVKDRVFEAQLSYLGSIDFEANKLELISDLGVFTVEGSVSSKGHFYIKTVSIHKKSGYLAVALEDLHTGSILKSKELRVWSCSIYDQYIERLSKNLRSYGVIK